MNLKPWSELKEAHHMDKVRRAVVARLKQLKAQNGWTYHLAVTEVSDEIFDCLRPLNIEINDSIQAKHVTVGDTTQHNAQVQILSCVGLCWEWRFDKETDVKSLSVMVRSGNSVDLTEQQLRKNKNRCLDKLIALVENQPITNYTTR